MVDTMQRPQPVAANDELILSSRVRDTAVYNPAGDKMGHIENLSIGRVSGRVRYALMSFGGFLGIGERFHPLPWTALKYDEDKDGYVVSLTKEQLSGAPSYTAEELSAYGGQDVEYRDDIYQYYGRFGIAPYM